MKTGMKKAGFKGGQLVTNFHEVKTGSPMTGLKEGQFVNSNKSNHIMGVGRKATRGAATMKTKRGKSY